MPTRVYERLGIAADIGVAVQPTGQRGIGAGELPGDGVVVAGVVIVQPGGGVGALAGVAVAGGQRATLV